MKAIETSSLKGKVCVIVGGTGLIGSEISREAAAGGAQVVIVARDSDKGNSLLQEITAAQGVAFFEQCDVTSYPNVVSLVEKISKQFGRVDGVVIATHFGTGKPGVSPLEVEEKDFLEYLGKNIGAPFFVAREFAKKMVEQKSGSIVFLSSIYGVKAPDFKIFAGTNQTVRAEYAASKAALISLTQFLAKYLGPHGVRVNALSPGAVKNAQAPSVVSAYEAGVPLESRMASPKDIAPAALYLLSDGSSYVTGQNIIIDGGWTL
jgi:NAD(P)-dependent dehydrogenase (short-subunit alcohol dehydrogenase family)